MLRQSLPAQFLIRNVAVWNAVSIKEQQDVLISEGIVDSIIPSSLKTNSIAHSIDGTGLVLLPSGVDAQVHLRVPGQPEKETALTGLRACVRGGYAAILTMPNTSPVIDCPAVVRFARGETADAEAQTGVEVLWSAAATLGQAGEALVDFSALASENISAFTDDGRGVASDELMDKAFAELEVLGLPFLQHAEVPGHGGVLAPGTTQRQSGVAAYPAEAEWKMVERDIALLRKHPRARYHVLHISSKETVNLIRAAKREGLRVTGEASPHHLLLTAEDIPAGDSSYKMNPPLRAESDREALIEAVANGDIDFVATDHAPHEPAKKSPDFAHAAFGTTGLETALRVLLHLCAQGRITPQRLVSAFSTQPAAFLGIGTRYGAIAEGRAFHAVLVNPLAPASAIELKDLESLSKNNCFIGRKMTGKIKTVFQPKASIAIDV